MTTWGGIFIYAFNLDKLVDSLITENGTNNPFTIAKNLDAIVLEVPLVGVNGFYHKYLNQNLIYIADRLTDEEKIIVCAHELGHMLLHGDVDKTFLTSPLFSAEKLEVEADAFAIQLLQKDLNLCNEIPLLHWTPNNQALKRRVTFKNYR